MRKKFAFDETKHNIPDGPTNGRRAEQAEIAVIDADCPTCGTPSAALADSKGVAPLECFNCTMKGITA